MAHHPQRTDSAPPLSNSAPPLTNSAPPLTIAWFGSSLVSAYWNGAATYYRGLIRELARRGHAVSFYEPDAYERQQHRDMSDPDWARVGVYPATIDAVDAALAEAAATADVLIKCSGVGVYDDYLEAAVLAHRRPGRLVLYCDVDAPATLSTVQGDDDHPLRACIPRYDGILTYGGGPSVVDAYTELGARGCVPIYNGFDPTTHHPGTPDARFAGTLGFLGNRLPDREARVDEFFVGAAARLPDHRFVLGGSGWDNKPLPANVAVVGHVYTHGHNAFNASPLAVLNIARASMSVNGYSPATRIFEAAAAGACIITDRWTGIEAFFEPEREILIADDGAQVAALVAGLTETAARQIGAAARARALRDHTYAARVDVLESQLYDWLAQVQAGRLAGDAP